VNSTYIKMHGATIKNIVYCFKTWTYFK